MFGLPSTWSRSYSAQPARELGHRADRQTRPARQILTGANGPDFLWTLPEETRVLRTDVGRLLIFLRAITRRRHIKSANLE